MAKAKSTVEPKKRMSDDKLIDQLTKLTNRIEVAECTAITVNVALKGQRVDYDADIAICVQRNIADELDRISKELAAIIVALGGKRHTPLRDFVLGNWFK